MVPHHSIWLWCAPIIIFWISIFNIYGSQMKWCVTLIISWIFIFNDLFAAAKCSVVVPLLLLGFLFATFSMIKR